MIPLRRQIPADNSCLFNAFSYVYNPLEHSDNSANNLRKLIAEIISNDPIRYNNTLLEMSNSNYQDYIKNPNKWGGALELSILSYHFKINICTFDIQSLKKHNFGETNNYTEIVYLLYDGIHYDSLIMTIDNTLPTDFDITKFNINDTSISEQFFNLVYELHTQRQYTDLNESKFVCLDCREQFTGQNLAIKHAKETSHQNLSEI